MDEALLDVKDIHVFYGNIEAVKGLSFHVNKGEIVCLIGANGAGKTTTLRNLRAAAAARGGDLLRGPADRPGAGPRVVTLGVAQSPEGSASRA